MRRWVAVYAFVVASLAGCGDDIPSCIDLGCPADPSGAPDHWEPCRSDECWCQTEAAVEACEVAP